MESKKKRHVIQMFKTEKNLEKKTVIYELFCEKSQVSKPDLSPMRRWKIRVIFPRPRHLPCSIVKSNSKRQLITCNKSSHQIQQVHNKSATITLQALPASEKTHTHSGVSKLSWLPHASLLRWTGLRINTSTHVFLHAQQIALRL